jgi:hypothetical protein
VDVRIPEIFGGVEGEAIFIGMLKSSLVYRVIDRFVSLEIFMPLEAFFFL